MTTPKLIQLLNIISIKDRRKILPFFNSGFITINKDAIILLKVIFDRYKDNFKSFDFNEVTQLFSKYKKIDKNRLRHVMSMLTEAIENYIVLLQSQKSNLVSQKLLLDYVIENQTNNTLFLVYLIDYKHIIQNSIHKEDFFQHKIFYENCRISNEIKLSRTKPKNYQILVNTFNEYFIYQSLKYYCNGIINNFISNEEINNELINIVLKKINIENAFSSKKIFVYYSFYRLLKDLITIESFNEILQSSILLFDKNEYHELYINYINICVRTYNSGNLKIGFILFGLYEKGIENKILLIDGKLSKYTLVNTVNIGIRNGDLIAVKKFVKNFINLINIEDIEETSKYVEIRMLFAFKKYDEALILLNTNIFKDLLWEINARYINIKIFFELKEYSNTKSLLLNFHNFVKKQKNIGYHKEYFLNIVIQIKLLLKIVLANKSNKIIYIEKFNSIKKILDEDWYRKIISNV